jgi:hypothetical protein
MKFGGTISIFSILVAVVYGVLFNVAYPTVSPDDGGIVALCALLGIATCLTAAGLWRVTLPAMSRWRGLAATTPDKSQGAK